MNIFWQYFSEFFSHICSFYCPPTLQFSSPPLPTVGNNKYVQYPRTSLPLPPPIEASRLKNWFVWLFWLAGPFWSTQLVCKAVPSSRSLKLVHLAVTPKCGGQTALDISSFAVFFLWVPEQVGHWILVFKIKNKDDLNMKTTKKMTQKIKVISK